MPELLNDFRDVRTGDVLMIKQMYMSDEMFSPREWRWFGLVAVAGFSAAKCHRLGGKDDTKEWRLNIRHPNVISVHLLDPDEWPDGVHALRAKLILLGVIDI